MKTLIAQGAEAKLYRKDDVLIKHRLKKSYRIPEIDTKLRKSRTKKESKILEKLAQLNFPAPRLIKTDEKETIVMDFLKGSKLSDVLEKEDYKKMSSELGKKIRILHNNHIIHGDLTTSNFILHNNEVFFVDFGLSFFSYKIEDKAVDLHLLRHSLEAKHYTIWKECFKEVLEGYNDKEVEKRLEKVERRGRYKSQV